MVQQREPSGEAIARRAYELYVERGGKHGKDLEDWVQAEKELTGEPAAVQTPAKTKVAQSGRPAVN
jgi:hypothetical protein